MLGKTRWHIEERPPNEGANEDAIDAQLAAFSPRERAELLERVPLFAKLRPADRKNLAAVGIMRGYPAGAELIHEGQRPGVGLYVILRGRVRLTQRSDLDVVRPLTVLGPGEMFGEMALIDELPRSATATAIDSTLAFIIPIFDFRAALLENPDATFWLLGMLSRRVRTAEASNC
ncbi:MAG TPA: cyclic nucleotide-binding domain-containing protein [Ktedonobacterales bacterium]